MATSKTTGANGCLTNNDIPHVYDRMRDIIMKIFTDLRTSPYYRLPFLSMAGPMITHERSFFSVVSLL
jgi:hypothetical protein